MKKVRSGKFSFSDACWSSISDKAKEAIEQVAAAQGFDYVIDASPGLGVIVAKGKDLLPDVKQALGF